MAEEQSVITAMRRLAVLESYPIKTPEDLIEWYNLRRWVLKHPDLLSQYREQHYFSCREEITKVQPPPEKPASVFYKIWKFLFPKKLDNH